MNVLVLCNKPPYPPKDGGSIATFNLAKGIVDNGNNVHILAINTSKHRILLSEDFFIPKMQITYVDVDISIKIPELIGNFLFSKIPYNAKRFISKKYLKVLENILKNEKFDIIQLEGPYMWFCMKIIRKYSNAKVSFRAHNIENELWMRLAKKEKNIFKKIYIKNLSKRIMNFELALLNQYDLLVPITERDNSIFIKMGNIKPSCVIPVGIETENIIYDKNIDNKSIFYIGALDWMPNQEGLIWFIDKIWPDLSLKYPDLKFHIAGRNAPSWITKYLTRQNMIFHGEIENSFTFICQSGIMIVPILSGSGMRVKIVEGMSLGKPIVTTSIGAEGLDVKDGEDILIADTVEEFGTKLNSLIENSEFTKRMSLKAHNNAVEKFNNKDIASRLVDFFKTESVSKA